jgi:hypothetical protein
MGGAGCEWQEFYSAMRFDALLLTEHAFTRAKGQQYARSLAGWFSQQPAESGIEIAAEGRG